MFPLIGCLMVLSAPDEINNKVTGNECKVFF
ncbi:hypothetical protein VPH159E362A_0034 [Vibrio phage 159E36-2a]